MAMKKSTSGKLALRFTGAIIRFIMNIIFYTLVVFVVVRGGTYVYHFSYQVFGSVAKAPEPGTDVTVQIFRGETTMNIASKLETSLLIVDKYSFYVKTQLKDYSIMPGTYVLNTSMDYNEILEVITNQANSIAAEESLEENSDVPKPAD
ncbi:MAG: endolytic transglycosylase MltG [Lachnospiraceae bacterium]|nr:endolytic transglycosylase MltG [Lachnospiraceae bacterium]